MAQKREKEETELKVKEALTLCINNCGVTGNPATNNMCQKCFTAITSVAAEPCRTARVEKSPRSSPLRSPLRDSPRKRVSREEIPEANRCSGCRRKVGLMGFRCRCGDVFCSEHRYSDRHVCTFDYKAAGREAIASENPVVKAAKVLEV